MRRFKLGQPVRCKGLGFNVRLVGWMESSGQLLIDYDGSGVLRWWCDPSAIAANQNGTGSAVAWRAAHNMYDIYGLRRLGRKELAAWLRAEKGRLDDLADDTPEHALQVQHLVEYAGWHGADLTAPPVPMPEPVVANDR